MHQGGSWRYSENSILIAGIQVRGLLHGSLMLVMSTHVACSPGWGSVLKHALGVLRKHFGQVARHGVGPEEVVVQCGV